MRRSGALVAIGTIAVVAACGFDGIGTGEGSPSPTTTTDALALLTAGAMAGRTVGDIANVGAKGYVVARGTGCGGDCVWEISLATGLPTTTAPIGTLPGTKQVNGLAHWGGKLYSFGSPDEVFVFDPTKPGSATKVNGPSGYVSVGYAGAATLTIAPLSQ